MDFYRDRKFWVAIATIVVMIVGERVGIDAETLGNAMWVIVSYIIGDSLVTGARALATRGR